jgi:hypothetical protein
MQKPSGAICGDHVTATNSSVTTALSLAIAGGIPHFDFTRASLYQAAAYAKATAR